MWPWRASGTYGRLVRFGDLLIFFISLTVTNISYIYVKGLKHIKHAPQDAAVFAQLQLMRYLL